MPPYKLFRGIHRGIRQNIWRQVEGMSQDPIPYTPSVWRLQKPICNKLLELLCFIAILQDTQ